MSTILFHATSHYAIRLRKFLRFLHKRIYRIHFSCRSRKILDKRIFTFINILISEKIFAMSECIGFECALKLVTVDKFDSIFMEFWKHDFDDSV